MEKSQCKTAAHFRTALRTGNDLTGIACGPNESSQEGREKCREVKGREETSGGAGIAA